MATVIAHGVEHKPAHHLGHAVRGHAQIVAVIAEHAAAKAAELEQIREERHVADMDGRQAGPGAV